MNPFPTWLHQIPSFRAHGLANGLTHGWTDIHGPDFKSPTQSPEHTLAVEELCRAVGLVAGSWAQQVHGGKVLRVGNDDSGGPGHLAGEADGLWTDQPGLGVIGRSADCPLILLAGHNSHGHPAVGMAHASWRSTLAGITTTLANDLLHWGLQPKTAWAMICPSAGPCCYEVGEEVREQAWTALGDRAMAFFHRHGERLLLDLWAANSDQLLQSGWDAANIHWSEHCTICGGQKQDFCYPSYRRQSHDAGRFAAVIGIRS